MTLFIADSTVLVFVVIFFTWFAFETGDEDIGESSIAGRTIGAVSTFEVVLAVWFGCKALSELAELSVSQQVRDYVVNFWNALDFLSVVCFFIGFGMRFHCAGEAERCKAGVVMWQNSVDVGRVWLLLYSMSLFLLWCRLLRILTVSRRWGPEVVLILRMGKDILRFALIWMLLLVAFSCLLRGSVSSELHQLCKNEGPSDDVPMAACWVRSWWVGEEARTRGRMLVRCPSSAN